MSWLITFAILGFFALILAVIVHLVEIARFVEIFPLLLSVCVLLLIYMVHLTVMSILK